MQLYRSFVKRICTLNAEFSTIMNLTYKRRRAVQDVQNLNAKLIELKRYTCIILNYGNKCGCLG